LSCHLRAVGLDDQAQPGPAEVRDDAPPSDHERHVHVGTGEATVVQEVEHPVLELTACRRRAAREHAREPRPAWTAVGAVDLLREKPETRKAPRLRAAHRPAQRPIAEDGREIEERACRRRHGDSAVAPHVSRIEAASPMDADAGRSAARADDRHLGAPVLERQEPEEHPRTVAAEERPRSARLHGREPPALLRQSGVADGVDAAVHSMQPPGAKPCLHRIRRQPTGEKLLIRQDTMSVRRAPRDERVGL
jgi:hypothetical protein